MTVGTEDLYVTMGRFYLRKMIYNKGLAQLDAEGGIWVSSAYVGTVESQIATKKPHTIEGIHRKFGGFQHFKNIDSIIQLKSVLNFKVGFCSALNEPAPFKCLRLFNTEVQDQSYCR